MLSAHRQDCTACARSLNCELQALAKRLGIQENRFAGAMPRAGDRHQLAVRSCATPASASSAADASTVCQQVQSVGALFPVDRGFETVIAPAAKKNLGDVACVACGQCVIGCPVGALTEKSHIDRGLGGARRPGEARGRADRAGRPRRRSARSSACPPEAW